MQKKVLDIFSFVSLMLVLQLLSMVNSYSEAGQGYRVFRSRSHMLFIIV